MWRVLLVRLGCIALVAWPAGVFQPARMPTAHAAIVLRDAASSTCTPTPQAATSGVYGRNLIVNGDAEYVTVNGQVQLGPGATVADNVTAPPPDWTVSGTINEVLYGAEDDVPGPSDPGPPGHGTNADCNFFWGGPDDGNDVHTAQQTIDVSAAAADIDTGRVAFSLSGYFGGYESQDDNSVLQATFLGTGSTALRTAVTAAVLGADRNDQTGLLPESVTNQVPVGTRSIVVKLIMTRVSGSDNDASADNLALVLTPPNATRTPTTTATPKAVPTATRTPASTRPSVSTGGEIYLSVNPVPRTLSRGDSVAVTMYTKAGSRVAVDLQLVTSSAHMLYEATTVVTIGSNGSASASIPMRFDPHGSAQATLVLRATSANGLDVRRIPVTVVEGPGFD